MWQCEVCGLVYDGTGAPEKCPKCGAPKEKFRAVPEDKAALINSSRLSNELHMELSGLLEQVKSVSERGIADNLDPTCVQIFTRAKDEAQLLQQMIKAEIVAHISKGKWG